MKRILLNTAFAAVLSLANTIYASVDNRDDLLVNQDNVSKNTLCAQISLFSEEIYKNIFQYLPLKSSGRLSQVSRDFKRLTNNRNKDLYPQFTHLLESIRDGRGKFTIYNRFPTAYHADANPDESDSELKFQVHSIKDDGGFILRKDVKYLSVIYQLEGSDAFHNAGLRSTDGKTYAGYGPNSNGIYQSCFLIINHDLQHSDTSKNAAGVRQAYILDDHYIINNPYILDDQINKIPVTIQSLQSVLCPPDIVRDYVGRIGSDGPSILEEVEDINGEDLILASIQENGMQILTRISEVPDKNGELSGSEAYTITNSGEMVGGILQFEDEDFAGIWVGKERVFFPIQKLLELGFNPMPKGICLYLLNMLSPNGKAMLGQGYLRQEDVTKQFWWTYVLSSDDSNLSNDMATLSTN